MAGPHVEDYTTNVPAAGTAVQIANTSRKVLKVWVKPQEGNSGVTYFGDSAVEASSTVKGWTMSTTEPAQLFDFTEAPPLQSHFWVDAATTDDKVNTVWLLE